VFNKIDPSWHKVSVFIDGEAFSWFSPSFYVSHLKPVTKSVTELDQFEKFTTAFDKYWTMFKQNFRLLSEGRRAKLEFFG
jgi:hypothetical protein